MAKVAEEEGERRAAVRFYEAAIRCPADIGYLDGALFDLATVLRGAGDILGAVRAVCHAMRLNQSYNMQDGEGVALLQLSYCAHDLKSPLVSSLVVLAHERIRHSTTHFEHATALQRDFGDVLIQLDHATRQQIEHDYRADRGARLLREAFGVDVDEIDALNERLGDATEDDLRGFLLDVQQYCTRDGEPPPAA